MAPATADDKKSHICPPSKAKHPSDRWESLFVYSFICKYTKLRGKVEGLETPVDLENALMSHEPSPILSHILANFVHNLRPHTRTPSTDQISSTVASVIGEYLKGPERTVFWDDDLHMNVDPFQDLEGGFFAADWDFKLKILRVLVEMQLCHAPEIKSMIDRAWGVVHNKHKKKDASAAPPDPSDPHSRERLQLVPLGQDNKRNRYWITDDSPRVWTSTNPWKVTAGFQAVSSTREEYAALIEQLKSDGPPPSPSKEGKKRTKVETNHLGLITALEERLEKIDEEIVRVGKVRKKIERRQLLFAQAEVRETRTRRQTRRPDYVYQQESESEDDADDYKYQDDFDDPMDEDDFPSNGRNGYRTAGTRRSSRMAANANSNASDSEGWGQWRGERRSTRLGASSDMQLDEPARKRARTDESSISTASAAPAAGRTKSGTPNGDNSGPKLKIGGAAAIRPNEIALEKVGNKKKSKFWFYAVEPIPGATIEDGLPAEAEPNGHASGAVNGDALNGSAPKEESRSNDGDVDMDVDEDKDFVGSSMEGSLSPVSP